MSDKTVTLTNNQTGDSVEIPVLTPSSGIDCIDISKLLSQIGMFTYDPGFMATASCKSAITYIDGDEGVLEYRGYPIEELAEKSNFLEVCYLLYYGELPNDKEYDSYVYDITHHTMLHQALKSFYSGFRRDAHPMAIMMGVVGALSAFYHKNMNIHDERSRELAAMQLVAKMPTIAAMSYRFANGLPFQYPDNNLSYAENFFHMMFSLPVEEYEMNPVFVKALDLILILHADHEQNASTSTVRLAGSSEANPFAAVASGIASLWGPAHGGANEAVIKMLQDINESDRAVQDYVDMAKDKENSYRLMGFGHRVYKNYDPRAKLMRKTCHEVLQTLPADNPYQSLFDTAMELEKIALEDEYFVKRNLYPNVDFYSGIILLAMDIPVNMFTVIFAMARTIGWISHWNEMMSDGSNRIGRPRQLYTGATTREYTDMSKR